MFNDRQVCAELSMSEFRNRLSRCCCLFSTTLLTNDMANRGKNNGAPSPHLLQSVKSYYTSADSQKPDTAKNTNADTNLRATLKTQGANTPFGNFRKNLTRVPLMAVIRGVFRALRTTKNFWVILSLRNSEEKKRVIFRNGCEVELTWSEYKLIQNILSCGYTIGSIGKLLCFKKGKIKVAGPLSLMEVLCEGLDKIYSVDCSNKIVLDVGGYIGDTAILFSEWGATKVIIYEPVITNHEFIKMNIALNGINAEIHDEGIGESDGYTTVPYDTLDFCFGLNKSGANEMRIKIRNVTRVIEESNADLAKFDCEGAEKSIVNVPVEILRLIDFYIIEAHTPEIKRVLMNKFRLSGFVMVAEIPSLGDERVSTIFFKRL